MPLSDTQILQLRTDRAKKVKEANGLLDKAREEKRDMNAEETQKFDKLHEEAERDLSTIEREERAASSNRSIVEPAKTTPPARAGRAAAVVLAAGMAAAGLVAGAAEGRSHLTDEQVEDLAQRNDAIDHYIRYGREGASAEVRQMLDTMVEEERAQAAGTPATGGYTVAPDTSMYGKIVESLKAYGVDESLFEVITTSTGANMDIPTNDDTAQQGAAVAENADSGAATDITLGQLTVSAYMRGTGVLRASLQFIQDTSVDAEGFIGRKLGERMGRKKAAELTTGTGAGQPQGIVTGSSLGVTAVSATAIAADELIDLEHAVDPEYRKSPFCRYMFNDSTLKVIKKLKDTQGRYLWLPGLAVKEPDTINGYGYVINQQMASIATTQRTIVFGDMKQFLVRNVRGFAVQRLVERYAEFGQVGFVGFQRYDSKVLNSAALKYLAQA